MDHHAEFDRAADQAAEARLREVGRICAAEEAAAAGASVSARPGMPGIPYDECGLDGTQPSGCEYRDQRRPAVEPGHSRTAHRAGTPDGAEEPGAGVLARDGRHD